MWNNNELIFRIKKKYLTIPLIAIIAVSLIIPFQIFAQNGGGGGSGGIGGGQGTPGEDVGISRILEGTCLAWASNGIVEKSSWYAVMCRPSVAGNIKDVVMDFNPDTYDVTQTGLEPIRTLNLQEGNLSGNPVGAVLTYTIATASPNFMQAKGLFKIEVGHVINPSPGSPPVAYTIAVTTKDPSGAILEVFPPTAPVNLEFVDSAEVLDESLTAADLAPNSVGNSEIANGAVKSAKLGANSVDSNKIADGSILAADISQGTIRSTIVFNSGSDRTTPGATQFVGLGQLTSSEIESRVVMPSAGSIRNLFVQFVGDLPAGESRTIAVQHSSVDTLLVCTVTSGFSSCSDTVDTIAVAAGNLISIKVVSSAGAEPTPVAASILFAAA